MIARFFMSPHFANSLSGRIPDKRKHSYRKMQDRIQQGEETLRKQIFN